MKANLIFLISFILENKKFVTFIIQNQSILLVFETVIFHSSWDSNITSHEYVLVFI